MFDGGASHLLVILIVALLVLGPRRLPEVARALGKGYSEFRRAFDEMKHSVSADIRTEIEKADLIKERPDLAVADRAAAERIIEAERKAEAERQAIRIYGESYAGATVVEMASPAAAISAGEAGEKPPRPRRRRGPRKPVKDLAAPETATASLVASPLAAPQQLGLPTPAAAEPKPKPRRTRRKAGPPVEQAAATPTPVEPAPLTAETDVPLPVITNPELLAYNPSEIES